MKKIIFILICTTIFCSCSVTTLSGTITAYNHNGEVLRKWEDVTIQEEVGGTITNNSIKTFGVNFYDKKSGKCFVLGNAVPYIIEYKVGAKETAQHYNITKQERFIIKEQFIEIYKTLSKKEQEIKIRLKSTKRGTTEYDELKTEYQLVIKQMDSIAYKLEKEFLYDVRIF